MKSSSQVKTDERDNNQVIRWVVLAVVVLLVGALSYNYFLRHRIAEEPAQATTQTAPQKPAGSSSGK